MPPRPTARCCRAARHVRGPVDNLWITDSVLASAFERYSHVSRLSRRKSSSLPGPLENRRRLGKRRMTGLYSADFQPTLPPWLIEYPVDLTQWKWSAPTPPDARQKTDEDGDPQAAAVARRSNRSLVSWMEQWLPAEAEAEPSIERVTKEPGSALNTTEDLPERLRVAFEALSSSRSPDKLHPGFVQAMSGLQQDLYLGLISVDSLYDSLESLPRPSGASRRVVAKSREMLCAAIVNGLAFSRVQSFGLVGPRLCNLLLRSMSTSPRTTETAQTFHLLMAAVPQEYLGDMSEGIQSFLRVWFDAPPGTRHFSIDRVGDALGVLSVEKHAALIGEMENIARDSLSSTCDKDTAEQRCLSWLGLLARMPYIDEGYFVEACSRSGYFSHMTVAKEKRLGDLLLHLWTSRDSLRNAAAVRDAWSRRKSDVSLGALAWYVSELEPPGSRHAVLASYLGVLQQLDITSRFISSFKLFCNTRPSGLLATSPFRLVASASRNYHLALQMYQLTKRHGAKLPRNWRSSWTWKTWAPHMKDMILDENVDRRVLSEVVHMLVRDDVKTVADEGSRRQKYQLFADMATWFSQATHLSDREMVRNVSRCNAWLRSQGQPVGSSGALALLRSAMRDLKRAEPGRTDRVNWALGVVRDSVGHEEAEKTARILQQWRRNNAKMARGALK